MAKLDLSVEDCMYVLMSYGALINTPVPTADGGNRKLTIRERGKIKRQMFRFACRYRKLCESAAKKFRVMTDVEKTEFFKSYVISEELKKECNL